MKQILTVLLFAMLLPFTGFTQDVTIIRDQDSGYFLLANADTLFLTDTTYVRGDTLVIAGQDRYNYEYTAFRAGLGLMAQNDLVEGDIRVVGGNDYRLGVDLWYTDEYEVVYDTVYVSENTDTLYIERTDTLYITQYDTVYVEEGDPSADPMEQLYTNHSLQISNAPSQTADHLFTSSGWTTADKIDIHYDCSDNVGWRQANTHNQFIYQDEFATTCTRDMEITYQYIKGEDTTRVVDITPLNIITGVEVDEDDEEFEPSGYYTDFINVDVFLWTNTWGDLSYTVGESYLTLDLVNQNIARLQWDDIPEHRNIRYTIRETLHASHATGVHAGGRHSESDNNKHSVETYVHGTGLGVSIFSSNEWSNPHSFPFEWEYGDVVTYTVEIIENTIRAKIWHDTEDEPEEWMEYTNPAIGEVPSGRFAIGSTGAGIYPIDWVEIDILD